MQLHLQTWPEVEAYLERSRTIIMPIGSTEQHGPNGLIGTDALTAQHIAAAAGAQAGILVAPTIAVGMAQHHMAFTGSMTLKPSTLILVIREYVESLAHHGFDRFYFLNGHGGNISTVNAAFQEIYGASTFTSTDGGNRPSVKCKLRNWWDGPDVRALIKKEFGDKDGGHATVSEVSVTQALFPDHIKHVPDMGPPSDKRGPWTDADDYRAKFPDGRIGSHPYLATPEAGQRLYDTAAREIAKDVQEFAAA